MSISVGQLSTDNHYCSNTLPMRIHDPPQVFFVLNKHNDNESHGFVGMIKLLNKTTLQELGTTLTVRLV